MIESKYNLLNNRKSLFRLVKDPDVGLETIPHFNVYLTII